MHPNYVFWFAVIAALSPSAGQAADEAQLQLPSGHAAPVFAVAWSPDDKRVLTGSKDATAIIWDLETGKCQLTLDGHKLCINGVSWSSDGKRVLTVSCDRTAKVWDAQTGKCLRALEGHAHKVYAGAWSPDGRRILTGSLDKTAKVWDAATGVCSLTLDGHTEHVSGVAWSDDGKHVITGSADKTAKVWDADTGKCLRTLSEHTGPVTSVAWRGKQVLTGSEDKTAKAWDAGTGKCQRTLVGHTDSVSTVAWSPDGTRVLTGSRDNTAKIWGPEAGSVVDLVGPGGWVNAGAWSRDGGRVLIGADDHTAAVWDVATRKWVTVLTENTCWVASVAWSGDGKQILAESGARPLVRDYATGKRVLSFNWPLPVYSIVWNSDGTRIFAGTGEKGAKVYDAHSGEPQLAFDGHSAAVTSAAWSPDGKRILTGSGDKTARVWDARTGKALCVLTGHTEPVTSVAWSPDGKRALTGSGDKTARVWDAGTGEGVLTLQGHTEEVLCVGWGEKGILTGSWDKVARVWNAVTGKCVLVLEGHGLSVNSVAWSPDGKRILTGSCDRTARVWDAGTEKLLLTLGGHSGWAHSVAWSPDGTRILTGSMDGNVRVWNAKTGHLLCGFLQIGDESIAWTPDGYYSASAGGEKLIAWRLPDATAARGFRTVGPEQFRKKFHRPELFKHLLADGELETALAKADRETGRTSGAPSSITRDLAPRPIIALPLKRRFTIQSDEIEFVAKAGSKTEIAVASITILLNGRPLDANGKDLTRRFSDPKPGQITVEWKQVKLSPGKHFIQVQVTSVEGTTADSEEIIEVTCEVVKVESPPLFVLSIGVSDYETVTRRGVEKCGDDAKRLSAALQTHSKGIFDVRKPILLTEKVTKKADILDAFDQLSKQTSVATNPVTVIFLAGHGKIDGRGGFYFLPSDTNEAKLRATAISAAELKDALKAIPGKVIVFMDACHSGALASDNTRSTGVTEDLYYELTSGEVGVVVMCSSRGKELSGQNEKGGYFTQALEEGLAGKETKDKDGRVYLPQLFAYVDKRVKEMSKGRKEGPQHPYSSDLKKIGELAISKP